MGWGFAAIALEAGCKTGAPKSTPTPERVPSENELCIFTTEAAGCERHQFRLRPKSLSSFFIC